MQDGGSDESAVLADAARLAAVAAGDRRAFARLVEDEAPRLVRLAALLLGSAAEAEEVVQDALLRLWQAAAAWRPEARLGTWLHRVVHRLCLDRLRRRRPQATLEDIEDSLADDLPGPEAVLLAAERDRGVAAALGRLPLRQRTALVLAHHQELSQKEAAAVMELGEEAYESLLARARRRLRELLKETRP